MPGGMGGGRPGKQFGKGMVDHGGGISAFQYLSLDVYTTRGGTNTGVASNPPKDFSDFPIVRDLGDNFDDPIE